MRTKGYKFNPVAKNMHLANKSSVFKDLKKESKKTGKVKNSNIKKDIDND